MTGQGPLPPRYRDPVRVGAGGMGTVYRAVDGQLGRVVAVKVMAEAMAEDPDLRDRFMREARVAARIAHPHVATIHDVGEWAGRPYIVMEHCAGGSIDRVLVSRPVGVAEALAWIAQAAEGIDAGHRAGVVHRDVKPHNLLLTADGTLKVSDFGIARVVDGSATRVTATGVFLGSAGYAAPETLMNEPATPAADVYALGVVAYELLTGGRPFGGRPTAAEMVATVGDPPSPPSTRSAAVPPAADPVFARVLAKDPADRQATARDFATALTAVMRGGAPVDAPTRASAPPPGPGGTAVLPPAPGGPGGRRRRRGVAAGVAAGLVALAAAGAGLAFVASDDGGDTRTPVTTAAAAVTTAPPATAPATTAPPPEVRTVTAAPVTVTEERTVSVATAPQPEPPADPGGDDGGTPDDVSEADRVRAMDLTDQAKVALDDGDPDRAIGLQSEAMPVLEALGDGATEGYLANGLYNLGSAHLRLGDCATAAPLLQRSIDLGGTPRSLAIRRRELREAERC